MKPIGGGWDEALAPAFARESYLALREFLKQEYRTQVIYPKMDNIYAALKETPLSSVRVVILGQDPYHEPKQAHGLAFSVPTGCEIPPSLQNIYKELVDEQLMTEAPKSGELTGWAKQGVLLLNTVLTVRQHNANSHRGKGWEELTDAVLQAVDRQEQPVVYLLWGANARAKASLLHHSGHLVLQASHPSPLSAYRGFFGCDHFRLANDFLQKNGQPPIDWQKTIS